MTSDERNATLNGDDYMSLFKRETEWSGNTYAHRDYIRSLGGRWDAANKVWIVPAMTMRERGDCRVPQGIQVKVR